MSAAFKSLFGDPCPRQHGAGGFDMAVFAGMGGAGEREFAVGKHVSIRRAALDQRQGLHRLDGGAREDRALDITDGQDGFAVAIDHRNCAAMAAFDDRAAQDFDENGVFHGLLPDWAGLLPELNGDGKFLRWEIGIWI